MIDNLINDALKNLKVPVSFQKYNGKENTYITFFKYLEKGELYADNDEKVTGYYIQVDVWSKNDYSELVEKVKAAMKATEFIKTSAADLFDKETHMYHKVIRFVYLI